MRENRILASVEVLLPILPSGLTSLGTVMHAPYPLGGFSDFGVIVDNAEHSDFSTSCFLFNKVPNVFHAFSGALLL